MKVTEEWEEILKKYPIPKDVSFTDYNFHKSLKFRKKAISSPALKAKLSQFNLEQEEENFQFWKLMKNSLNLKFKLMKKRKFQLDLKDLKLQSKRKLFQKSRNDLTMKWKKTKNEFQV